MKFILAILLAFSISAHAECPHLYPNNTPIAVPNTVELCNDAYVSVYDPVNRKVLFTSELLQPFGHVVKRKNSFHADRRVADSVSPNDYEGSGYDRGHMAPADDSVSAVQMYQSFLMTNMTPQEPKLNRGRWKSLETNIRTTVEKSGVAKHVVTGAIYADDTSMNGIPVPTAYYKILFTETPVVRYTSNNAGDKIHKADLEWVFHHTNIIFK